MIHLTNEVDSHSVTRKAPTIKEDKTTIRRGIDQHYQTNSIISPVVCRLRSWVGLGVTSARRTMQIRVTSTLLKRRRVISYGGQRDVRDSATYTRDIVKNDRLSWPLLEAGSGDETTDEERHGCRRLDGWGRKPTPSLSVRLAMLLRMTRMRDGQQRLIDKHQGGAQLLSSLTTTGRRTRPTCRKRMNDLIEIHYDLRSDNVWAEWALPRRRWLIRTVSRLVNNLKVEQQVVVARAIRSLSSYGPGVARNDASTKGLFARLHMIILWVRFRQLKPDRYFKSQLGFNSDAILCQSLNYFASIKEERAVDRRTYRDVGHYFS